MKKIGLLTFLFLNALLTIAQVCTPNPAITKPGIDPAKLPDGIVGSAYSEVVTLMVPLDTAIVYGGTLYNVKVDSASVISISHLPTNFGYECDKPSRTWNGGQKGCAKLYGTPTSVNIGDYVIYVKVRTFFKIVGLPNALDQVDSSTIDFKVRMPTAMQELTQTAGFSLYPNPAHDQLHVRLNQYSSSAHIRIIDLLGKSYNLLPQFSASTGEVIIQTGSLEPGVYVVSNEIDGKQFQTKFVKE